MLVGVKLGSRGPEKNRVLHSLATKKVIAKHLGEDGDAAPVEKGPQQIGVDAGEHELCIAGSFGVQVQGRSPDGHMTGPHVLDHHLDANHIEWPSEGADGRAEQGTGDEVAHILTATDGQIE